MPITAILGEQWGDEGKGRFSDMLTAEGEFDAVARATGGPNAGHTVVLPNGEEFDFHGLPSGFAQDNLVNVIGNGTVIDPIKLYREISALLERGIEIDEGRLLISSAAHLITPYHIHKDEMREAGLGAQGSTKSGISFAYADKAKRVGMRAERFNNNTNGLAQHIANGLEQANEELHELNTQRVAEKLDPLPLYDVASVTDLYMTCADQLSRYITDTTLYLNRLLRSGGNLLAEGAQAFGLDIDHGTYPDVTSASTAIGGIVTGLGIPANFDRVIGVTKATPSRVGNGPLLTEIPADTKLAAALRGNRDDIDGEYGTTTGRVRRMGHLDLTPIMRAQMVNGTSEMVLTKLDRVPAYGKKVAICIKVIRKAKILTEAPDAAYKVEQCDPIYEELPTWRKDVSDARRFEDLPPNAKRYVSFIEEITGVPITMLGVGPRRDQVILRD